MVMIVTRCPARNTYNEFEFANGHVHMISSLSKLGAIDVALRLGSGEIISYHDSVGNQIDWFFRLDLTPNVIRNRNRYEQELSRAIDAAIREHYAVDGYKLVSWEVDDAEGFVIMATYTDMMEYAIELPEVNNKFQRVS